MVLACLIGALSPDRVERSEPGSARAFLRTLRGDWCIGAQTIFTNYQIVGQTALDDDLLNVLGLKGFNAGGVCR